MTGWASSIISPSSVTSTRSTPWVAGCWGPTLRVMSWVCSSRSALSRMMMPTPVPSAVWKAAPPGAVSAGPRGPPYAPFCSVTVLLPRLLGPWPGLGLPGQEGELLAQRVPLELLGQEQLGQVGVAVEGHAEQLGGLALVPVGARPQVVHARQVPAVARHHRAHLDVVTVVGRVHVQDQSDARVLLVDPAEEVEEVAGDVRVAPHELGRAAPPGRGDRDRQQPVGDLGPDLRSLPLGSLGLAELDDQVVAQGLRVHAMHPPGSGS